MAEKLTKAQARIVRDNALAAKLFNGAVIDLECWIYGTGNTYGTIATDRGTRKAHRVSYEVFNGPIPEGYSICHHCDRPACVNPKHLFIGTFGDNMRDMVRKGRAANLISSAQDHFKAGHPPRGEDGSGAKIDERMAIDLLNAAALGEATQSLAQRFQVNRTTVQRLLRGETWKHLPRPRGLPRRSGYYSRNATGRAALQQEPRHDRDS